MDKNVGSIRLGGMRHAKLRRWGSRLGLLVVAALLTGCGEEYLQSTINPVTPPAFTSMITGRNPGAHGIYDFLKKCESQDDVFFALCNSMDIKCETIWTIASRQKRKVGALNFIFTAPPFPVSGYIVPGLSIPVSAV